jgi:hypothetical protein
MSMPTRRSRFGCFVAVLVIAVVLTGCGNKEAGKALLSPPPMLLPSVQPTSLPTSQPIVHTTVEPTVQPTPTRVFLGPLIDADLSLNAGPVEVPLELRIPSLKVNAPVLGVGITAENYMDSPKGPIDDPVWHSAFWYRGSGIPGDPGTAAIAGHVNDPLGRPEIFARLHDLRPGQSIIVHDTVSKIDIRFIVDEIKVYSIQESSDPAVLTRIFGVAPLPGAGSEPGSDGLSHLTLITCAGNIVNGRFDHHTVVYATRSD